MCRSSRETGGPRRCSADARGALADSAAAVAALESRRDAAVAAVMVDNGPPKAVPQCFFCDALAPAAAHLTRYGKVCCGQCWPDVRLTQGPGGGL